MRTIGLLIVSLFCEFAWADIGVVSEVRGEVTLVRAGEELAAVEGVEVQQRDVLATGADSAAQIDMEDGSVFRVGADTRLDFAQYRLNADRSVLEAGVKLVSGWLRFAVAKLKPQAVYKIHTQTLTLGVRGTEGVLESNAEESGLAMDEGEVTVDAVDEVGVPPELVRAREYIARRPGARFFRPAVVPAAFLNRLPPNLRAQAVRRAHLLQRRGVVPQALRRHQQGASTLPHRAPAQSQQRGEPSDVQRQQHRQLHQQRQQRREGQQQQQRPRRHESERRGGRD